MLHSGTKFRALRDKNYKYSNSCVVRKQKTITPPLQVKWSVPHHEQYFHNCIREIHRRRRHTCSPLFLNLLNIKPQ